MVKLVTKADVSRGTIKLTPKELCLPVLTLLVRDISEKSNEYGSLELFGSVGARHTILLMELYARNLLSGLSEASVIVHWPDV